ncbi:hypothetical protein SORBI_3003G226950 [Sorghum bicolor]|uniref:Uncharacterized protein n=1 Tax=Sorghum bicolor TaxID=4558 RepID=A0A1W0VYI4_SORBI|nr:hypothetical protein SORBI_3003G226950 [Sorghum bicolor]
MCVMDPCMVALHGLHPQLATTMPMRTAPRQRHPPRQRWLYSTAAPLLPPTASSPDATLDVGGAGFHHVTRQHGSPLPVPPRTTQSVSPDSWMTALAIDCLHCTDVGSNGAPRHSAVT